MISLFLGLLVLILSLLQTDARGLSSQGLHHHMTKREIEYYFGVTDHDSVPEYEVSSPYETNEHGAFLSYPLHSRKRRSNESPKSAHYKLNAFGSNLQLKLTRNDQLMAPNLRVLRHNDDGTVTSHPAPENSFYLGRVVSDPDSTVAVSKDGGLTGMVKTFEDTLFIHPLPAHLVKHLNAQDDVAPHLVYKKSIKQDNVFCETKEEVDRFKRSLDTQNEENIMENPSENNQKYLKVNLIAPRSLEEKYLNERYHSVIGGISQYLMVLANMVAGMFLDSSIGERKIIYLVTNITIVDIDKVGFLSNATSVKKLIKLLDWAKGLDENLQDYFDVFTFISDKIASGALATANTMCWRISGNVNKEVGLQTALHIAHETAHHMGVSHDSGAECLSENYIMSASLPGGEKATKWSECSRKAIQAFLADKAKSYCLDDLPSNGLPTVPPHFRDKLPGEIVHGDMQCEMHYGKAYRRYYLEDCRHLFCINNDGVVLSRITVVADGTKCGFHKWCINGQCVNSGAGPDSVDGGWTNWSPYTPCSYPCGGGLSHRSRHCTNPRPKGGKPCFGEDRQYRTCNSQPCQSGQHGPPSREMQCSLKNNGSVPYYWKSSPCTLWCRMGNIARPFGLVEDGTRCTKDQHVYDLCISGTCKSVGCDNVLGSGRKMDRCGVCGGNGTDCTIVKSSYTDTPPIKGPWNAGLIVELPIGTTMAYFAFKKPSMNYLGVKDALGQYLVGGHLGFNQNLNVENAHIVYMHPKRRSRDRLAIHGPTNSPLRVMFISVSGKNPGVNYYYKRNVQFAVAGNIMFDWVIGNWSECSRTCAVGERQREINCIRKDDKSSADDAACPKPVPAKIEQCNTQPCQAKWSIRYWNACSKTCGKGRQIRDIKCLHQESLNVYTPTDSCSPDEKPTVETVRYCNEYPCPAQWNVDSWSECSTKCAKGRKHRVVTCSRVNEEGIFTVLADEVCRYKEKPIADTSCNDIDPCGPRPTTCPQEHVCSNGGLCVPDPAGYKCHCVLGYVGLECEVEVNPCDWSPCLNGGVCSPGLINHHNYTCKCMQYFTGRNCEVQVNPCDRSPCLNGGVCSPGLINYQNYTCKCMQYFTGRNCEDGEIFPIGCFASKEGLIPELRGDVKRAIDESNTDPAVIKCAALARNKGYSYFALGLNRKCLSSSDAGEKYFMRGSTNARKCKNGIGLSRASFVYTFEALPSFRSLGCYRFRKGRNKAFRTRYISFRNQMKPQNRTWAVHQCARVAHNKGIKYFSVRFLAECFFDPNAETRYASLGKSNKCDNGVGTFGTMEVYVFEG